MEQLHEQLACYGSNELSTAQLLALALGQKEALERVAQVLATHGVRWLRNASVQELRLIGFTMVQATRLHAVCEITKRFAILEPETHVKIKSNNDAENLLRPLMAHLDHEEMRVLVLDSKNRVMTNMLIYSGTVNSCDVRCAEILRHAIVRNCPGIILAHNHPSGDPCPSQEDLVLTKQLMEAGRLLDVEVLDHIIIGHPHSISLMSYLK